MSNLDAAVQRYAALLGRSPHILPPEHYAYGGLRGARFYLGNGAISLVSTDLPDTPIGAFLSKRGEGINHISLEVDNLEEEVANWRRMGVQFTTSSPLPYGGGRVIFTHPKSLHGVQIALVEVE